MYSKNILWKKTKKLNRICSHFQIKIASFQMVSTFAFFPQYPTASSYNFEFGQLSRTRARKLREQNFQLSTQCSEIRKKIATKNCRFARFLKSFTPFHRPGLFRLSPKSHFFRILESTLPTQKKGKKIIEKKGTANFVGGFQ